MKKLSHNPSLSPIPQGKVKPLSRELEQISRMIVFVLESHQSEGAVDARKYESVVMFFQSMSLSTINRILSRLNLLLEHGETFRDIIHVSEPSSPLPGEIQIRREEVIENTSVFPEKPLGLSEDTLAVLRVYDIDPRDPLFSGALMNWLPLAIEEMTKDGQLSRESLLEAIQSTRYFSSFDF